MSADNRFEEPLERLRTRIDGLRESVESPARDKAIRKLSERLEKLSGEIYANLTPWQKTLVARHPARPFTLDYVRVLLRDFVELHGDRVFGDDMAIVGGLAGFVLDDHAHAEMLKSVRRVLISHLEGGVKGFPFKRGFLRYLKAHLRAHGSLGGSFR